MLNQLKKLSGRLSKNVRLLRWYGHLRNRKSSLFRGLLFVILVAVGTILFPRDKISQYSEYQVDTIAPEEIISNDTFPINKSSQEYEREKEEAQYSILAIFYRDFSAESDAERNIVIFFNNLQQFRNLERDQRVIQRRMERSPADSDTSLVNRLANLEDRSQNTVTQLKREYNIDVNNPNWSFVQEMSDNSFDAFKNNCVQILQDLHAIGLLSVSKNLNDFEDISLTLIENSMNRTRNINEFFDKDDLNGEISARLSTGYEMLSDTISVGLETIRNFLIPNIKYNSGRTDSLRNEASALVAQTRGFVLINEKIIDKNEKITPEHFQKIESYREFLEGERQLQSTFAVILLYIGQTGFIAIFFLLFVIYLYRFRPAIVKNTNKLFVIFLIFLTQFIFLYLITQKFGLSEYLLPTTIASMLLTILIDGGVGLYGTITIAFIAGGYMGFDFSITMYVFTGGTAALIAVRHIRRLSQFFKAILFIFFAYSVIFYITGIIRGMTLGDISLSILRFSLPNAVLSPLITLGFLALYETFFGLTSDMTLLELSDLNSPLLRDLAMTAPGTYHHSIVIGNLSERAAEAIGANSLLARVGCYYHDIGKMVKPKYFIENEPDAGKKHDALAPSMSSLIISSHIREGLEIADKHKLPEVIKEFISQHHGTSRISFFYEKALKKSKNKNINPADYCYPGPKPQTKETGIVMLADGVEAATRSLKDPSPTRIRERVESIVAQRFQEGQLDECDVTVKDLRQITESFIQILSGIFHVRIEYPEREKEKSATGNNGKGVKLAEK